MGWSISNQQDFHLISNKMIWVRSLRCDYICENKDDVWVHKRVSFFVVGKVLYLEHKIFFYKFPFSQQLNFCQVHIPAEKLVECGDCVWVGDRLDNIRFSFNSFFVTNLKNNCWVINILSRQTWTWLMRPWKSSISGRWRRKCWKSKTAALY